MMDSAALLAPRPSLPLPLRLPSRRPCSPRACPAHPARPYLHLQIKYGVHASSGGGRSSARETIGRVAAGAIAEKWLRQSYGTTIVTFVSSVGTVDMPASALHHASGRPWTREEVDTLGTLTILRNAAAGWELAAGEGAEAKAAQAAADAKDEAAFVAAITAPGAEAGSYAGIPAYEDAVGVVYNAWGVVLPGVSATAANRSNEVIALRCPHAPTACRMATLIRDVKAAQDSTGGILATVISGVPVGLGEPCFDKLEAKLAHAMLSLPATKAFEIGSGFEGTRMRGSQHNDAFVAASSSSGAGAGAGGAGPTLLRTVTNNAGGTLGGISSGADLTFRVAIKPVSTISQPQATAAYDGSPAVLEAKGRHDPCVLPRAPPLVEAMAALVLADAALIQRSRGPVYTLPQAEAHADAEADGAAAPPAKRRALEAASSGAVDGSSGR